jgi:hypothetical protein
MSLTQVKILARRKCRSSIAYVIPIEKGGFGRLVNAFADVGLQLIWVSEIRKKDGWWTLEVRFKGVDVVLHGNGKQYGWMFFSRSMGRESKVRVLKKMYVMRSECKFLMSQRLSANDWRWIGVVWMQWKDEGRKKFSRYLWRLINAKGASALQQCESLRRWTEFCAKMRRTKNAHVV